VTILDSTMRTPRPNIPVRRLLATLLLALPYVLGWCAGSAVTAMSWAYAAIVAGWRAARTAGRGAGLGRGE
jgi:hypothetical protein